MLIKNWLIRTKSNHILGPVSKAKVIELYKNGSVKADDEFCSGNGYWFFVKEKALVDRYLLGEVVQEFNPISEALDVLQEGNSSVTAVINLKEIHSKEEARLKAEKATEEEIKLPDSDELDYPDMEPVVPKVAPVQYEPPPAPPATNVVELKAPAAKSGPAPEKKSENITITPPKRREVAVKAQAPTPPPAGGETEQRKKLYITAIMFLIVVILAVLYRKSAIGKKIILNSLMMNETHAQVLDSSSEKKKYSLLHQ